MGGNHFALMCGCANYWHFFMAESSRSPRTQTRAIQPFDPPPFPVRSHRIWYTYDVRTGAQTAGQIVRNGNCRPIRLFANVRIHISQTQIEYKLGSTVSPLRKLREKIGAGKRTLEGWYGKLKFGMTPSSIVMTSSFAATLPSSAPTFLRPKMEPQRPSQCLGSR